MKSDTTWRTPAPAIARRRCRRARRRPRVSVGVGSPRLVRWFVVREVVNPSAPAAIAVAGDPPHRVDVVGGGRLAVARRARPSRRAGPRRAAPASATSTSYGRADRWSRYSAKRLPGPRDALVQRGAGDVLDALHQLDDAVVVVGPARREADAAVAHHHRRHAVPRRRHQPVVPRRLAVVVRVDVDEARRDERAVGVDDAAARRRSTLADGDDAAVRRRRRRRCGAARRCRRRPCRRGSRGRAPCVLTGIVRGQDDRATRSDVGQRWSISTMVPLRPTTYAVSPINSRSRPIEHDLLPVAVDDRGSREPCQPAFTSRPVSGEAGDPSATPSH